MPLTATLLKETAHDMGFQACGIARAASIDSNVLGLERWLEQQQNGNMEYMRRHVSMRHDPSILYPGARSVVSLIVAYKPSQQMHGKRRIAMYAYGEDYHTHIKAMLYRLVETLQVADPQFEAKVCVDTAPLAEKYWAVQAGLGWIGRNTLLVNPDYGSLCLLGELVTSYEFDHYDSPMTSRCGDCRRCVDACPNQALHYDHQQLQATRCTSYHTIENRDSRLPESLHTRGYVFGCDCCQNVCPYNQQAPVSIVLTDEQLEALEMLTVSDERQFRKQTRHRALNRINYSQWQRNLAKGEDDMKAPQPHNNPSR